MLVTKHGHQLPLARLQDLLPEYLQQSRFRRAAIKGVIILALAVKGLASSSCMVLVTGTYLTARRLLRLGSCLGSPSI